MVLVQYKNHLNLNLLLPWTYVSISLHINFFRFHPVNTTPSENNDNINQLKVIHASTFSHEIFSGQGFFFLTGFCVMLPVKKYYFWNRQRFASFGRQPSHITKGPETYKSKRIDVKKGLFPQHFSYFFFANTFFHRFPTCMQPKPVNVKLLRRNGNNK